MRARSGTWLRVDPFVARERVTARFAEPLMGVQRWVV